MIEYRLYHPSFIDQEEWRTLQSVQRSAFALTLPNRSQSEIDTLVDWDDPDRYHESHEEPNSEVGKRFGANQEYTNPQVAVAIDIDEEIGKDELIGFAYSAYNVSGDSSFIRGLKKQRVSKNYLWIRDVAVKPDYQRQHIAMHMARLLLTPVNPETPVTAYAWVDEISFLPNTLDWFHLFPTGEAQVKPFGEDSEPIRQVRYQGQARDIQSALKNSLPS